MKRTYIAFLIFIISIVIFYFFILPSINISQFLESFRSIDFFFYAAAILSVIVSIVFASSRWSILLREVKADKAKQLLNSLGIFSIGLIAGLIVPSRVGSYVKVPLVKKIDTISYGACVSAVNAETILDLFYICCAGIISFFIIFPLFSSAIAFSMLTIVLCSIVIWVIYLKIKLFHSISERMSKLKEGMKQNARIVVIINGVRTLFSLLESTKTIFTGRKTVLELILLTVITQLFGVSALYLVTKSVHVAVSPIDVFAILTISYVIGIISLIPGGLGVSDLSLIILFENVGVDLAVATNIAILWRFCMYFPVGLILILFLLKGGSLKIQEIQGTK